MFNADSIAAFTVSYLPQIRAGHFDNFINDLTARFELSSDLIQVILDFVYPDEKASETPVDAPANLPDTSLLKTADTPLKTDSTANPAVIQFEVGSLYALESFGSLQVFKILERKINKCSVSVKIQQVVFVSPEGGIYETRHDTGRFTIHTCYNCAPMYLPYEEIRLEKRKWLSAYSEFDALTCKIKRINAQK